MSISPPERFTLTLPDGAMTGWRWSVETGPRLVFAHANGFNAGAYAQMLSALHASAVIEIVAVDLRGHGRTTLPCAPDRMTGWAVHAADLRTVIDTLSDRPLVLAGHSMGAASLILALAQMETIISILAIEPVLLPPWVYAIARSPLHPIMRERFGLVRTARARRARWPSRAAVLAAYRDKPLFTRWADGVLEDYLRDGLVEDDQGVRLACAPDWEAANFGAQAHAMWRAVAKAAPRLNVLKSGRGSTVMRPGAVRRLGATLDAWPDAGHLAPMETPERCADWLADRIAAAKPA